VGICLHSKGSLPEALPPSVKPNVQVTLSLDRSLREFHDLQSPVFAGKLVRVSGIVIRMEAPVVRLAGYKCSGCGLLVWQLERPQTCKGYKAPPDASNNNQTWLLPCSSMRFTEVFREEQSLRLQDIPEVMLAFIPRHHRGVCVTSTATGYIGEMPIAASSMLRLAPSKWLNEEVGLMSGSLCECSSG
jgi:DNA replicative helicase MCM subunit Mcm2 (Cdc46/Mcm family)